MHAILRPLPRRFLSPVEVTDRIGQDMDGQPNFSDSAIRSRPIAQAIHRRSYGRMDLPRAEHEELPKARVTGGEW